MECDSAYIYRCHKALAAMNAPMEGWFCTGVRDHGVDSFTCQLCGCKRVRYIHVMRHVAYLGFLEVGCICAGVMEGDILAAKERDAEAKRRSQRKSHYLKKTWNAVGENRWRTLYKRKEIIIWQEQFCGRTFFKININGEQYHWKDNRRMGSFLAAQHYVFDLVESEVT